MRAAPNLGRFNVACPYLCGLVIGHVHNGEPAQKLPGLDVRFRRSAARVHPPNERGQANTTRLTQK